MLDIADRGRAARTRSAGRFAVLSAAPYHLTVQDRRGRARRRRALPRPDRRRRQHARASASWRSGASTAFIPQCGLAPGFISIVAADLARRFDTLDSVRMRVGALPAYPSNALNYNLTWSTDGVINEYIEPCEAIVDGRRVEVPALEEREEFSLDGVLYEAFNTSGGLGTLAETLEGQVRTLNYRTIRYPGHAAIMKALLHDLRLRDRRDVLKDILENARAGDDAGRGDRLRHRQRLARRPADAGDLRAQDLRAGAGRHVAQRASRSPPRAARARCSTCWPKARLPQRGFVRQEDVPLADFLANRFGSVYANVDQARAA